MTTTTTSPARSRSHRGRGHGAAGRRILAALPMPPVQKDLTATTTAHPYQPNVGDRHCAACWGWVDDPRHTIRLGPGDTPMRFRKRPVEVDAIEWTGSNLTAVQRFTGEGLFRTVPAGDVADGITGQVYDRLHNTWVGVRTGNWIIRGVQGEYYPIAADVLAETYEPVTAG